MKSKVVIMIFFLTALIHIRGVAISGYILDSSNGERITYANVMIAGEGIGAQTNSDGVFSITGLKPGSYQLLISCLGYAQEEISIHIADELDEKYLKLELTREAILMEGKGVSDREKHQRLNYNNESNEIRLGKLELTGDLIQDLPQAADADVIRSLEVLPGVQSMNEQSNGLYIRGGTPDQNQILLDGTEVYNPSHLGGIFSTFNSDAIASVDLYKAGFPSRYGDRLSSVLDIRNKDGNRVRHEGIFRLSMMSSSGTLQGPWRLGNQKGSYMASFRRTLYELLDFDIPDSYFYDGHVKLNWDAGIKDKVFFSSYFGKDFLHMEDGDDMDMSWGNNTLSGQWLHVFNSRWYGKLNLANSRFNFDLKQVFDGEDSMTQTNKLNDITLKADMHYLADNAHDLEFGTEIKSLDIVFNADTNLDINTEHYPWLKVPSAQASIYCEDSWELGDKWTLQPGLRYTWCRTWSEYLPEGGSKDYHRISPRMAVRYKLLSNSNISFSYGRYYQYLTATNRSDWPMSLWLPIDKSIEPGEADHYVAGIKTNIGDNLTVETELYYKSLRNQVAIDEDAFMEWTENDQLSKACKIGDGYSWGGEILLSSRWNGLEGFFNYTYSKTMLKIAGMNLNPLTEEAEYYHPQHDRTHTFNIIENYYLSQETGQQIFGADINLGMVYKYATGQPQQAPEGIYEDIYGYQFVEGYLDNKRLPAYSRLDVSLKFKWQFEKWSIEPYLMIVNALDKDNIWTRDWYPETENSEIVLKYRDTYMFSRMPFLGINFSW